VVEDISALRIETPQAVQRFAQLPIPYSSTLQQLDVLAAYVVGKDGKQVDVPADRIMVQQTPQSAGAPMFDDGKVKVVVFPAVEVGSVLHLHTRRTQLKPLFPEHFSAVETSPGMFDIERAEITVEAPAGLKLQFDAVSMEGGKVEAGAGKPGTQSWRWTVSNWKALPFEAGSVAPQDASPRLAMTTLADDQAAASAYAARALPAAAATDAIRKLADEVTAGVTDRRAQAEAL
jgi:transglutaminase-like putative cysteine protease